MELILLLTAWPFVASAFVSAFGILGVCAMMSRMQDENRRRTVRWFLSIAIVLSCIYLFREGTFSILPRIRSL